MDVISELWISTWKFQRIKVFFEKGNISGCIRGQMQMDLGFNFLPISINVRRMLKFVKKKSGNFFMSPLGYHN